MPDGDAQGSETDAGEQCEDLAAAARERTRRQVKAVFAATPEEPLRECPHCGAQRRTRWEHCPVCHESYFIAPPRFSRRTRRALTALAAVGVLVAVTALAVLFHGAATDSASKQRSREAASLAAERRRLAREQAPHHGRADVVLPGPDAGASARRRARRQMVARLQAAITADARARRARGELNATGLSATVCAPLVPGARDEDDLDRPLGRYSCNAVSQRVRHGSVTSQLGIPFVAVIRFHRGTFTWCKDNPVGAGDVDSQLAFVRLARECTAARGPAFGSGYLPEPAKR
jgi:hypothetical protein